MEIARQRQIVLEGIDAASTCGLEIGPLARPMVDKRQGFSVKYVDHDSTEALRERFANDPLLRVEDIVDVDFVVRDGKGLLELIGAERFDYIIASHVFEHVPNPVQWLKELHTLLKPGGRLSLIVPDRRFTFDVIRPATTLGEWLEWYYTDRKTPSFANVFDQNYYWREIDVGAAWRGAFHPWALNPPGPKATTLELAKHTLTSPDYVDVHCNILTDTEFGFLFQGLVEYGLTEFALLSLRPCEPNDNEFFVQLGKASSN